MNIDSVVSIQMEDHATGLPKQQGEDPTTEPRGGTKSHRRSNSYTYTTLEVGSRESGVCVWGGGGGGAYRVWC